MSHVNDAPAGIAIDDQVDGNSDVFPEKTGVIDIAGFLAALKEIVGTRDPSWPSPSRRNWPIFLTTRRG